MQRQRIILIIGVVLALLSVVLIKVYMDQQAQQLEERKKLEIQNMQKNQTSVLVARTQIQPGTVLNPNDFDVRVAFSNEIPPDSVSSMDSVSGMMVVAPILPNEPLTRSKLVYPGQGGGLAEVTPKGKRAITISVDNISSLAGMIKPKDSVDVIALVPIPVQGADGKVTTEGAVIPMFQNVQVLAVGQDLGGMRGERSRYEKEEGKEASPLITLALTPQEASLIAFVQEQGKIRLVLRSPSDANIENIPPASWQTFFQYVMPQQQPVKTEPQEPQASSYVEVYRGLNKEKVPIYK